MNELDTAPDPDLDNVATIAIGVAERIRDDDPRKLYDELVSLAYWHPAKTAQLIMALAAWFDVEESTKVLRKRMNDVTKAQLDRVARERERDRSAA